jgi:serine protease AprX
LTLHSSNCLTNGIAATNFPQQLLRRHFLRKKTGQVTREIAVQAGARKSASILGKMVDHPSIWAIFTTMKTIVFCWGLFCSMGVAAQYNKHVVQLTNKQGTNFSLANPSAYLSAKSIERRQKQGIAIDSSDLPLVQRYLDSIRNAGVVRIVSVSKWLNQVLIETVDQAALASISNFSFVRSNQPVGYRTNIAQSNTDKFAIENDQTTATVNTTTNGNDVLSYGNAFNQINLHEGQFLHNKNWHGQGITIAVLDAGFSNYNVAPAFDSARQNNRILSVRDFVNFDGSVHEDDIHGMRCFSIMAANQPGLLVGSAPKANYHLLRTENIYGEWPTEEHNWLVGAEYADSVGCDMISASLGYNQFDNPQFNHTYAQLQNGNSTMVSRGANLAHRKGMIVVNSAGNEGNNPWRYIAAPGDADSIVTVGAVNAVGNIASFSSYGFTGVGKLKPNIVSIGVGTWYAGIGSQPGVGNGTSFSTPNVAGLIACLWQAFPNLKNSTIIKAVYESADRFNNPDSNRYGYGIPNFKKAYRALKQQQNALLFGTDWLKVSPLLFEDSLRVDWIGRVDGSARLELLNNIGQVVATQTIVTETEEIFDHRFANLRSLPGSNYQLKYSDSLNTRLVPLQKKQNVFDKDWLVVYPSPFNTTCTVAMKAQADGVASFWVVDGKGGMVASKTLQVQQGREYFIYFPQLSTAAAGTYAIVCAHNNSERLKRVVKQ